MLLGAASAHNADLIGSMGLSASALERSDAPVAWDAGPKPTPGKPDTPDSGKPGLSQVGLLFADVCPRIKEG